MMKKWERMKTVIINYFTVTPRQLLNGLCDRRRKKRRTGVGGGMNRKKKKNVMTKDSLSLCHD